MPGYSEETFGAGDQSWIGSTHGIHNCRTLAPDPALFPVSAYPNGVPSGTPIGIVTATGRFGPYTGDATDEVQTLTVGGSGLTSFTLTFGGQTTDAIVAAASAAAVQAALEELSTIGEGNVAVTGSNGGPWTVRFQGDLENTNVAQLTTTPTGGSGTVTAATTTAGGADGSADGRELLAGHVYTDQKAGRDGGWPVFWHGLVNVDRLPVVFLATGHNQHPSADLSFTNGGD